MIGETLNERYRILSILGTGRCGQTFLAEDNKAIVEPRCVIKQFEPEAKDTLSLRKAKYLFAREVKVLKILGKSDRIPQLLTYFREGDRFYLVHEFVDGSDLAAELGPGKLWSIPETVALLREILEIVEVAHREKVIHQDIKPTSIVRRKSDSKLILIDFGSVKKIYNQIANAEGKTEITVPIGTLGYMAPEQKSVRPKLASDIYAVGMISLYALTGVEPKNIPLEHQTEKVQWRDLIQTDEKLAKILDRMLSPHLKQRYKSAGEALQAIRNLRLEGKLLNVKIWAGMSALILAISGAGYYYWQLENSMIQASSDNYFESEQNQFPFLYRNADYGIELKYPSSWKLTSKKNTSETITAFIPQKSPAGSFVPEVNVQVNQSPTVSLEEYTTQAVYEITLLPEVKIIDSLPTKLNDKKAHKIVYTQADLAQNLQTKHLQIWTLEKGQAYILTYKASIDEYDNFVDIVENEIFQSLKIEPVL